MPDRPAPASTDGTGRRPARGAKARFYRAVVMEYSIGHVTFAQMLQRVVDDDPTVQAEWMFIGPTTKLWPATMFPFSRNYTLEVSATARRLVGRAAHFDVLFLHTQTLSLFLGGVMRRVPTVISVDARP